MNLKLLAAALVAAALALAGIFSIAFDSDDGHASATIKLRGAKDTPAGVPSGPAKLTLSPNAKDALDDAKDEKVGGHAGAIDETPSSVPQVELLAGVAQQDRVAKSNTLPDVTPLAAPFQPGCRTRMVGNYSSRNGVRPRLFVLHYTVSPNRPGFADVDGITAYFNGPSQASSNYIIDADGNCNYIVRETSKPWTQAGFNPFAVSVEVIATGSERVYLNAAGYRKLGAVIRDVSRRWDIPIRLGATAGCTVTRSGIVDHRSLGGCGGGHSDIGKFSVGSVIAAARGARPADPRTKVEKAIAAKRCYHRREHLAGRRRAANLKWARYYRARIIRPRARGELVGGHVQLVTAIDRAKAADRKPWSYRRRGARRKLDLAAYSGRGC